MLSAGAGQSSNPSAAEAAKEAANRALSQAGLDRADLVLVFFTADHVPSHQELVAALRDTTRTEHVLGCSGAGVLTGQGEIEGGPGVAVLVLRSDTVRGQPFLFQPLRERDEQIGAEIARAVPKDAEQSLLVLLPDGYNGQPRRLFHGMKEQVGFLPVVGAGCSENGTYGKTFQLCGEEVTTNALSGLALSGSFESSIEITQGCQPITQPMTITKAEGNFILEIDKRPAFEVFAKVVKGPLLQDLRRALAFVFAGLPSEAEKNSVAPGEYLVRNVVGLDSQKGIVAVSEEVFEGERMVFTLRDGQRAREDLNQMLQRQLSKLGGKRPELGLYFNCCARGTSLYGIPGIDTAYIRQSLGDFPLIGFFGNFELGPLGGTNHLLAYTGVLALISEKLDS